MCTVSFSFTQFCAIPSNDFPGKPEVLVALVMGKKRDRSEANATSGKNTSGAELKLNNLVAIGFRFRAKAILAGTEDCARKSSRSQGKK